MANAEAGLEDGPIPTAWLAAALGVFTVVGAAEVAWRPMNGDASWYVYIAGRFLDGDRPYIDLIDTNPPLILWLNMGVVALARLLRVGPLPAFQVGVFGLVGLSLGLAWRTGRGLPGSLRRASLGAVGYMLLVGVGPAFGQREHLALALVLPYTYAASTEARGQRTSRRLAIVAGLLAGVGFGLKPFFALAAAAVEVVLAVRRGARAWLRLEALAMLGVGFAYGVALVIVTPQYFEVARRLAPLYPAHNPVGSTLADGSWRLATVVAAVGLAWTTGRRKAPGWAGVFAALDLGFTAAVYLTGKGWNYHWFPPMAISLAMGLGAVALGVAERVGDRNRGLVMAAMAALIVVPPGLSLQETMTRLRDRETCRVVASIAGPGEAVFVLSPWIHKAFPMVMEAGVAWCSRYPMLLPIAAFYPAGGWSPGRYHTPEAMDESERRFVGEVRSDFLASHPALLLVDDDPPTPRHAGFAYLEYFRLDPAFARALNDYEFIARTPSFRVYHRREAGTVASTIP